MDRQALVRVSVALVAVICAVVIPPASGNQKARVGATDVARTAAAGSIPGTAAMRAYVNPETGALGVGVGPVGTAPRALDAHTQNALRRDATGLVEIHHPNGAVSVNLQGRFQSVSVLKIGKAGRVVTCVDNADEAQKVLQGRTMPEVK